MPRQWFFSVALRAKVYFNGFIKALNGWSCGWEKLIKTTIHKFFSFSPNCIEYSFSSWLKYELNRKRVYTLLNSIGLKIYIKLLDGIYIWGQLRYQYSYKHALKAEWKMKNPDKTRENMIIISSSSSCCSISSSIYLFIYFTDLFICIYKYFWSVSDCAVCIRFELQWLKVRS